MTHSHEAPSDFDPPHEFSQPDNMESDECHPYVARASELVDEVADLLQTQGPEIARNRLMAGIMTAFIDGTEEGRRLFKAEHDSTKSQKRFGIVRNQQGAQND